MEDAIIYPVEYYIPKGPGPDVEISSCFKQFSIHETSHLQEWEPDIGRIIKYTAQIIIESTKISGTYRGSSEEGQAFTGKKLIADGHIIQKVEYRADNMTCAVHVTQYKLPFSTFIMMPGDFKTGIPVSASGQIEDIVYFPAGKRSIYISACLLLTCEYQC